MATRLANILTPIILYAICSAGSSLHVVKNICFTIHLTSSQQTGSLTRGIGMVQKHLTHAVQLTARYQASVFTARLRNKTLPALVTAFELPELMLTDGIPGGSFVELFDRLAVASLIVEKLEQQEKQILDMPGLGRQLTNIKTELVTSLCYTHLLLHLTSRYLSADSLQRIRQLYGHSLTPLDRLPHSDREWRFLRDYAVVGALHRVVRRSIRKLQLAASQAA